MGKFTAIQTYDRFTKLKNANKIDEHSLNFILDTGQLYTHGIFLNNVAWGTETTGAVELTIAGVKKTLSLSNHTHSNYLEKNANIDLGAYKIVSGTKDLLYYSSGNTYLGNTSSPLILQGSSGSIKKGDTTYTILDTQNFTIQAVSSAGHSLQNAAKITYGSSSFQIDYIKRLNTTLAFNDLNAYSNAGVTLTGSRYYAFLTLRNDGSDTANWAQLRFDIASKSLQYRTSADSTTWYNVVTSIPVNALNVAGIVAAPTSNDGNKFWGTDSNGNPGWKTITNSQYYLTLNGTVYGSANTTNLGTFYAIPTSDASGANQVWMRNTDNNGYTWVTLGDRAFDSTSYLPLIGGTLTGAVYFQNGTAYSSNVGNSFRIGGFDETNGGVKLQFGGTNGGGSSTFQIINREWNKALLSLSDSGAFNVTTSFCVTESGNVGIGTGNPSYRLDVNGLLNATSIYENGTLLSDKYLLLSGGAMNTGAIISLQGHVSYPLTSGDTVFPVIKINLNSYGDSAHNVAALCFANEPGGWYKGFFGYERTYSYDGGDFVWGINYANSTASATYSDIKMRLTKEGNLSTNGTISGTAIYYNGNACIHAGNIGSQSVNYSTYSSLAYRLRSTDQRYEYPSTVLPNYSSVNVTFSQYNTLGISSDYGTYFDVLAISSYMDSSGGNENALIFSKSNNSVFHTQFGVKNSSSWGTPYLFLDTNNYSNYALPLAGGTMTGNITFSGNNDITWSRNTDYARISFKNDSDGDADSYMSFTTGDNGDEYFRFDHAGTEWVTIKSDGIRVKGTLVSLNGHTHSYLPLSGGTLIGKDSGASDQKVLQLCMSGVSGEATLNKTIGMTLGFSDTSYYTKIACVFESQNPAYLQPALAFYTMDNSYLAGSEVERMRISANGNVGIGTTSPTEKLQVLGNIRAVSSGNAYNSWSYRIIAGDSSYGGVAFLGTYYNNTIVPGVYSHNAALSEWNDVGIGGTTVRFYINGGENSRLTSTGLGIGTTSPSYKLDVNGTLNATTIYENGTLLSSKYLPLTGGTLSGTLSFSNNIGISGIMGGGTDNWGIVGTGDSDNGRLKIYVGDNGTTDWLDFEFIDYSGTTYTPLSMTGNQIIFNYNPTVSGYGLIHSGNIGSQSVNYATSAGSVRYYTPISDWTGDINNWYNYTGVVAGKLYGASNAPLSYYAFLHAGGGQYYMQFNARSNVLYFRSSGEDGYTPNWTEVITSSNIGSQNVNSSTYASSYLANRQSIGSSTHATSLQNYFNNYKSSIPRNCLTANYSSAYGNGSLYFGYFLSGYDDTPYGGFYVCHYNTPYYVGISYGSFSEQQIITSSSIGSQSVNYANSAGSVAWDNVSGKPSTFTPSTHSHDYLPLSGGTLTGNLSFSNSGTEFRGINYGTMGDNDQWRIGGAATGSNGGYMEIATADDGNEPIYVRQYTGVFSSVARTLTLLDSSGNTNIPGNVDIQGDLDVYANEIWINGSSPRLLFHYLNNSWANISMSGGEIYFNAANNSNQRCNIYTGTIYVGKTLEIYSSGNNTYFKQKGVTAPGDMCFEGSVEYQFDARIYAYSFENTSDIRKKNIIDNVKNINIYDIANAPLFKFTWKKENRYSGQHVGSSAQYWRSVLPELVSIRNDADQTLGMQYDVIALASAITVAKKVVDHEERINILENENKMLKEKIIALEQTYKEIGQQD